MQAAAYEQGIVLNGQWPDCANVVQNICDRLNQKIALVIADPPYGNVVSAAWDKSASDIELATLQIAQANACVPLCYPAATCYWFGGYGKPLDRTFFRFCVDVEHQTRWRITMPLVWEKKRAYGTKTNYLATREEIAFMVLDDIKHPRTFNVPYTDEDRGYAGYNPRYPAKSKFKRQNAVLKVTEILRGKRHPCEKPPALLNILIETSSNPGDVVLDLFSGSGACAERCRALGRYFISVERDQACYDQIVNNLGTPTQTL